MDGTDIGGTEIPMSEIFDFQKNTFRQLRDELGHLKTCQMSILIFGSAAAGIYISLLRNDSQLNIPSYFLLLLPMLFLLPLYIVYYEKARTIARIVGFLRVQEKIYLKIPELLKKKFTLIGWESAMKKYWITKEDWNNKKWDAEFKSNDNKKSKGNNKVKKGVSSSYYWFTMYCTFFFLNASFLGLSWVVIPINNLIKILTLISFIIFLLITFVLIYDKYHKMYIIKPHNREQHTDLDFYIKKWGRSSVLAFLITCLIISIYFMIFTHIEVPLIPYIIICIFSAFFKFTINLTFWMLNNLVLGRYSYDAFEKRWQIILRIRIMENDKGDLIAINYPIP